VSRWGSTLHQQPRSVLSLRKWKTSLRLNVFRQQANANRKMRSHVRPSPAACDGNRSDDDERRSRAELDAPSADRRGEFVRRWSCLSGREGWYYSRGRGVGGGDADDGPRGSPMLRREERIEAVANFYRMVDLYGIDR